MLDIKLITDGETDGNGYFDTFMASAKNHIEEAVDNNTITQEAAGEVYTSIIPGILAESIRYAKDIDLHEVDLKIKNQQLLNSKIESAIKLLEIPESSRQKVPATIQEYLTVSEE